jgi:hypothetical protein
MGKRRPQINFQVDQSMKLLYEEAKASGHWVTRFCAAGFLMMVEDPKLRARAISRLREWEVDYADASEDEIRGFVEGAEAAMRSASPSSRRVRKAPRSRKKARRG